jgi:hypothetical protein
MFTNPIIHTEQDFMYNWIRKHSGK